MLQTVKLLLPALLPSWNFFDVIAASPRIEYVLLQAASEDAVGWCEFRPRPKHVSFGAMLARVFFNARWNETLFAVSCAERLLAEPAAHSQDEIFQRIAADLTQGQDATGVWLNFRIILLSEQEGAISREVSFVSDPRPLASIPIR